MAQFLRPDSTLQATNWNGGFADIDEATFSDADAAYSNDNTAGAILEVGLSNPANTPGSGTCTVRYRHAQCDTGVYPSSGGGAVGITCLVLQGTTTLVTDTEQTANEGAFLERSFTFDASLVTDWTDLRLEWITSGGGGNPASRRGAAVSWAELEVPDGAVFVAHPYSFAVIF